MGWRTTIRESSVTTLTAWAATQSPSPDVHAARPEGFAGLPSAYVGRIVMLLEATAGSQSGLRRIEAEAELVIVGVPTDNAEEAQRLDALADSLTDWLSDRPHFIADNTVAEPVRVESRELSVAEVIYPAIVITVGRILIREGRS